MFGYVGSCEQAPQVVLAGLKKLEYRGYDSWGIAARRNGRTPAKLLVEKHVGKIGQASTVLPGATAALGHTRWATHGGVTRDNAHPHLDCQERLAVSHNGIIENHAELRAELIARGHTFRSQTDTEVAAHLLEDELTVDAADSLVQATMRVFGRLEGLSAISVLDLREHSIAVAKNGSPLVLGHGGDGNYLASDSSALLDHTRRLTFLEDGQAALITANEVAVYDVDSGRKHQSVKTWNIPWVVGQAERGEFPDYMTKEIDEQPRVLRAIAQDLWQDDVALAQSILDADDIHLVGCGSAAHAARWGEYLFAQVAQQRAHATVGSEFAHTLEFLDQRGLVLGLSQSGETIDLLEVLVEARRRGARLAALVNVEGSSIYRLVDQPVLLGAGPERCVLATKSFTAKLAHLLLTAFAAGADIERGRTLVNQAASEIEQFLADGRADRVRQLARRLDDCQHLYVIGRGPSYPLALEAALKIKEVSYVHAEAFAGGEMKHGAIALVEPGTPCLVLAPRDETYRAIVSGAQELKARGAYIIGISPMADVVWDEHIEVADLGVGTAIVNALPPQVLAHELAVRRGLDPDKPRNLAKSVTVR